MKPYARTFSRSAACWLVAAIVAGSTISGCVSAPGSAVKQSPLSNHSADYYSRQLARQLFAQLPATSTANYSAPKIAVASFLPVSSLSLADVDPIEVELANQLSENMLMLAHQHGFEVFDYRLRQQLLLSTDHEQALSRQLNSLGSAGDADAILSGTYSKMQDGLMLNVRLISLSNKKVLAAASGFVPANVMWSQQQVTMRGGKLYRSDTTGEQ